MDDLSWDVLQKLYIGLCIQYILVSVCASSVTFVCVHRELNTQKCEIFLCPPITSEDVCMLRYI